MGGTCKVTTPVLLQRLVVCLFTFLATPRTCVNPAGPAEPGLDKSLVGLDGWGLHAWLSSSVAAVVYNVFKQRYTSRNGRVRGRGIVDVMFGGVSRFELWCCSCDTSLSAQR